MTSYFAQRILYEQPSSEVLEMRIQGVVCGSETQNLEDPTAPGEDNTW